MKAELLALRTTRSTLRFVAGSWALALFLAVSYLGLRDLAQTLPEDAEGAVASASAAGLLLLLLGAASASGETRHGTLPGALVAAPDRVRLVLAKAAATALLSAAAGAAAALLAAIYVLIALALAGGDAPPAGTLAEVVARTAVYCALMGVAGAGAGAALRSQAAAVALPLVVVLVADPLLASISEVEARWGPGGAAASLLGTGGSDLLPGWAGALLLAGYAGACVAAGAVALRRRDVL